MTNLCIPTIIFIVFSIVQIVIDIFSQMYNTAIMKFGISIIISLLLNFLCNRGLGLISWMIVFIPFIFMTVIVTLLLYIFGLNPSTGTINFTCKSPVDKDNKLTKVTKLDINGNILIYDPEYNEKENPVYYNSPYIVVPNPFLNDKDKNDNIIVKHPVFWQQNSSEYTS